MSTPLQHQFRVGKSTFLLDGRVVEYFYQGSPESLRFHVDHLAIGTKPHDSGLKVRFGLDGGGIITGGGKEKVPAELVDEFNAFVAAAIAARTDAT